MGFSGNQTSEIFSKRVWSTYLKEEILNPSLCRTDRCTCRDNSLAEDPICPALQLLNRLMPAGLKVKTFATGLLTGLDAPLLDQPRDVLLWLPGIEAGYTQPGPRLTAERLDLVLVWPQVAAGVALQPAAAYHDATRGYEITLNVLKLHKMALSQKRLVDPPPPPPK